MTVQIIETWHYWDGFLMGPVKVDGEYLLAVCDQEIEGEHDWYGGKRLYRTYAMTPDEGRSQKDVALVEFMNRGAIGSFTEDNIQGPRR